MKKFVFTAVLMLIVSMANAQRVVKKGDNFILCDIPLKEQPNLDYFTECMRSYDVYQALVIRNNNIDVRYLCVSVQLYGRFKKDKFVPYKHKKSMKLAWKDARRCLDRTDNELIRSYMSWRLLNAKVKLSRSEQKKFAQSQDFLHSSLAGGCKEFSDRVAKFAF